MECLASRCAYLHYLQYLQYLLLLQTYFRHTGQLLPNQTSGNLRIEVDCATLAYYDWLTHVKQVATLSVSTCPL